MRPRPQRPVEVPPAVVVLPVDTTEGDSTRIIIQRDFDFGDRLQPLILDDFVLADIWKPGGRRINFSPWSDTMGALPQLYGAASRTVKGGEYFGPNGLFESRGYPTSVKAASTGTDRSGTRSASSPCTATTTASTARSSRRLLRVTNNCSTPTSQIRQCSTCTLTARRFIL